MALRNYILIPVGLPNRYFLPGTKATLSYKIIQPLEIWELIFITPSCTYTNSVRTLNFNIIISKLKYLHFLTTQINFKKFYPEVFIYGPLTIIWGFDNFSTCFFIHPDKISKHSTHMYLYIAHLKSSGGPIILYCSVRVYEQKLANVSCKN